MFGFIRDRWRRFVHNDALKHRLYIIIFESDTYWGKLFDVTLLFAIIFSIMLVVVESLRIIPPHLRYLFTVGEYLFTFIFTLEYLIRLYCAPSPRRYALSFYGIIDLLSTLPLYLGWIFGPMRYFMVIRTFRLMRVFRVFRLFSFLDEGDRLMHSLMLSSRKILVFFLFVVIMVISLGTLMYMVESGVPDTQFTDIPTSIYWAVVTMTTVGYGDIAPVTAPGRFISAIVMLLGYTIMAVPTGIVSAQFIQDHQRATRGQRRCPECGNDDLQSDDNFCRHCGARLE